VFVKINTVRNWRSPKHPASISFARKGFQVSRGRYGRGRLASISNRSIEMARGSISRSSHRIRSVDLSTPSISTSSPAPIFGFCFQRVPKSTPGPPPFASMNSTPAASRGSANHIVVAVVAEVAARLSRAPGAWPDTSRSPIIRIEANERCAAQQ
jgi:hypothetical protein